ncbi:MAG: hypothetical protein ACSHWY_14615 [Octadecabacter sp.]
MKPTVIERVFRSVPLSRGDVGWVRPMLAVVLGLLVPALLAMLILYVERPTLSGLPKDGSGFTAGDHVGVVFAALAASFVVSWLIAPVALILLRYSAIFGWAGSGSAVVSALIIGLPTVHFALNGDVTTENSVILPHISIAISLLSLAIWGIFVGLMNMRKKSPNFASKK